MEGHKEEPSVVSGKCYPPAEAEYQQLVDNADLFLHKLTTFHATYSTNFFIPSIGGSTLDLHRLFVEVTSRGGLDQVIRDRKWEEIVSAFEVSTSSISGSFLLRKYYVALLYHFELVYFYRRSVATLPITDAANNVPPVASTVECSPEIYKEFTSVNHLSAANAQIQPGISVVGNIDEKFDNGYVVSVNMGSDMLKGILYHIPDKPQHPWSPYPCISQRTKQKYLA